MVSKKILGVAIAAALSSQAFGAATNLSSGSAPTPLKIAKQSVLSSQETSAGSGWYNAVDTGGALDFDIVSKMGIGLAVDQKIYVKVKLANAKFGANVTTSMLTVTCDNTAGSATVNTVAQGGAAGDDTVIFTVSPAANKAFFINDTATLDIDALQLNGSSATVTVTTYDSVASAVAGTNVLYTANGSNGSWVTFPSDAVTAASSGTADVTASVANLFKTFLTQAGVVSNANKTAQLGQLATSVASYSDMTGTAITLGAVADTATSTVKYKGDFSAGTWYASDDAIGTTKTALTLNGAKTEATIALSALATKPYLLVVENGTAQVPVSTYTADVTFTAPSNGVMGAVAADTGNAMSGIKRDGTTVLVPFINVNPDFNQKIIIVNRSDASAALTLSNAIGDAAATNFALTTAGSSTITLPANKQTVLNSADLLSVDAGSTSKKGAVTLNIAAPSNKVDVLFQSTNAQGAQNTVILQNDGNKFGSSGL